MVLKKEECFDWGLGHAMELQAHRHSVSVSLQASLVQASIGPWTKRWMSSSQKATLSVLPHKSIWMPRALSVSRPCILGLKQRLVPKTMLWQSADICRHAG